MSKLLFNDVMALAPIPTPSNRMTVTGGAVKRYMSLYPAWVPGSELVGGNGRGSKADPRAAYGGHVYCQAPLAASRAIKEEEPSGSGTQSGGFGLHVRLRSCAVFIITNPCCRPFKAYFRPPQNQTGLLCMRSLSSRPAGRFARGW